jgi:hypothetical protein
LNKQQLIEQISEQAICDEILFTKNPQQTVLPQSEVIAMLLKKVPQTHAVAVETKEKLSSPLPILETSSGVSGSSLQQSSQSAFYGNNLLTVAPTAVTSAGVGLTATQLQTILSLSPNHTLDDVVGTLVESTKSLPPQSHVSTLRDEEEPELVSHSTFTHETKWNSFIGQKMSLVPLLPLKEFLPQEEEFLLPYGWEERVDERVGGEGDRDRRYYFNTLTQETLRYEIHPSDLLENNWRRCVLESSGEEYFFNDVTGMTSWEQPHDAFDDISTDGRRESELKPPTLESRAPPPVPKFLRLPMKVVPKEVTSDTFPSDLCERNDTEEEIDAELALKSERSDGGLSSDVQMASKVALLEEEGEEAKQQRVAEAEKEKEVLDGMFGTFTSFYSAKNQTMGEGVVASHIDEFGDGISALDDSYAFRRVEVDPRPLLLTGYSSNDGDGDETLYDDRDRGNSLVSNDDSLNRALLQSSSFASSQGDDSLNPTNGGGEVVSLLTRTPDPHQEEEQQPVHEQEYEEEQVNTSDDPFANNPQSWIVRHDSNGLKYFENTISGETSWDPPPSLAHSVERESLEGQAEMASSDQVATVSMNETAQTAPPEMVDLADPSIATAWQMYFTETGIPYYFNTRSGESQWAIPSSLQENNGNELIIRSNSEASYLVDLTPTQTKRENSFVARYDDIYSLLDPPGSDGGERRDGTEAEEEESPYLIDLMDFSPKGRRISDLL